MCVCVCASARAHICGCVCVGTCMYVRCVEPCTHLAWAYGQGSVLTIDVMLSVPGVDFEGAEFCTLESNGQLKQYEYDEWSRGDALLFMRYPRP